MTHPVWRCVSPFIARNHLRILLNKGIALSVVCISDSKNGISTASPLHYPLMTTKSIGVTKQTGNGDTSVFLHADSKVGTCGFDLSNKTIHRQPAQASHSPIHCASENKYENVLVACGRWHNSVMIRKWIWICAVIDSECKWIIRWKLQCKSVIDDDIK